MAGKQIRLYLVDGTAGGLTTAEIINWSGHVIGGPRSELAALLKRDEANRSGVYLLLGDDPETADRPTIYVGEGDEVAGRLRAHAREQASGGKDFWQRVVVVTSKDANLTKSHVRYLESRLIQIAHDADRATLVNGTSPPATALPEADAADMEYFLTQLLLVLPVLGVSVFRRSSAAASSRAEADISGTESPLFKMVVARDNIVAHAKQVDGEFTVLKGSTARSSWIGTHRHKGAAQKHSDLVADGSLILADGRAEFTRNVVFTSPSAAGCVVTGRASNGRTDWVASDGMQFGQWQDRGL